MGDLGPQVGKDIENSVCRFFLHGLGAAMGQPRAVGWLFRSRVDGVPMSAPLRYPRSPTRQRMRLAGVPFSMPIAVGPWCRRFLAPDAARACPVSPPRALRVHPCRTRTRQKVTTDVLLGGRHIHHLRHGNAAGALALAPGTGCQKWWFLSLKCCAASLVVPKGVRGCLRLSLGCGVFRSFTCFCDAVFCAAAQGRGRSTWGMGWRAFGRAEGGLGVLMGSAWPSAAGGLGCRRQVSEALCQ